MNTAVEQRNSRLMAHRLTAHRMTERGSSLEAIADHLRVSKRSVMRYLNAPRPQEPAPKEEVSLADFYMKGACGSFPEYDWLSRSSLMQKKCKEICAHCPVLASCREWGLTTGLEDQAILGGLSRRGRLAELRRREAVAAGASRDEDVAASTGAA